MNEEKVSENSAPDVPRSRRTLIFVIAGLLMLVLAGYLVWEFWGGEDSADAGKIENVAIRETCQGDYIDTHLHFDELDFSEEVIKRMKENRIGCAVAFINMSGKDQDPGESLEVVNENPGKVIPFFHLDPKSESDLAVEKLQAVIDRYPGYFKGFGEIAFYREPFKQSDLRDKVWSDLIGFLDKNDLWWQFHLRGVEQVEEFEELIEKYPNAKFLLHGPELSAVLPTLLKKYDNLYFTLDTASLLERPGSRMNNVLMYPQDMQKGDFVSYTNANYQTILNNAVVEWQPVIEAAPERVMWGTDGSFEWHAEKEVYELLMKFSKDFIVKLKPEHQGPFARQNAEKLLSR